MKKYLLLLILVMVSGCASRTANLGSEFNIQQHANIADNRALIIIYADRNIEDKIALTIWHNGDAKPLVFPGTYLRIVTKPGESSIQFWDTYTGGLFGINETKTFPKDLNELYLKSRYGTTRSFDVQAGQVLYLKFYQEYIENFVQCGETEDTTSVCIREKYTTHMEEVSKAEAKGQLTGMKESIK